MPPLHELKASTEITGSVEEPVIESLGVDRRIEELTRIAALLATGGPLRRYLPLRLHAFVDDAFAKLRAGAPGNAKLLLQIYRAANDAQILSMGGEARDA
jgi:hypothetical protein